MKKYTSPLTWRMAVEPETILESSLPIGEGVVSGDKALSKKYGNAFWDDAEAEDE